MKSLGLALAAVQLLDIALHAATGQLEPLRLSANLVILLWLVGLASSRLPAQGSWLAALAVAVYLVGNGVFLALEGLTNPAQGGAPRLALFAFVVVTVVLACALIYARGQRRAA